MKKIQAYLDTNVVLDFCWDEFFSRETKKKDLAYRLFETAAAGEFEAYISYYTMIEVGLHFTEWFLLNKCIKGGFSHHQFKSHKKNYTLSQEEKIEVEKILDFIKSWEGVNVLEIEKIEGKFFKNELPKYILSCIELMDAFHINSAVEIGCTHFVTKDEEFRKRIDQMKNENLVPSTLRVATPKGFMNEVSRKN